MFTGIIEQVGKVVSIETKGTNLSFWIESAMSTALKVDQSVSHNGVCLTVEEIEDNKHRVTAIAETLSKTNLHNWQVGSLINLERCMQMNGRLDGHLVQGHVDAVGKCIDAIAKDGSWEYVIAFDKSFAALLIEKGSITLNGISLTAFDVQLDRFKVAIIPYTYEHTNMQNLAVGDVVNLEFDLIGKYLQRSILIKNLIV
jgi:riboflavin synthase